MTDLRRRTAALVERAGHLGAHPIVAGLQRRDEPPVFVAQGSTATGAPLTPATTVYIASLAKQITAACAALLAAEGRLDPESTLATWMPELPTWAHAVRLRHLVHHTAGLPADALVDALLDPAHDRTTAGVVQALTRSVPPVGTPGAEQVYSNTGYVCLAVAVERAAGRALPDFARERVFAPLAMHRTRFWTGPASHPPGAAPLDDRYPAPLSLGDGGVWSTAEDLLRWNGALDADELGVSARLHTPGRLNDGTALQYAGGLGLRTHAGHRLHRHGGGWPGVRAQLLRLPDHHAGLVVLALTGDTDHTADLADALLGELI